MRAAGDSLLLIPSCGLLLGWRNRETQFDYAVWSCKTGGIARLEIGLDATATAFKAECGLLEAKKIILEKVKLASVSGYQSTEIDSWVVFRIVRRSVFR